MSKQPHNTPTRPRRRNQGEWEVWVEVYSPYFLHFGASPVFPKVPVSRMAARPAVRDIDIALNQAFSDVPAGLDLGDDDDGSRIIAYEAVCNVLVRDPDGYVRGIAPPSALWWRKVVGWEMLPAYEQFQRAGEGVVEKRRNPRTYRQHLLYMWVWRPAV